jgi:hypothetical protein
MIIVGVKFEGFDELGKKLKKIEQGARKLEETNKFH